MTSSPPLLTRLLSTHRRLAAVLGALLALGALVPLTLAGAPNPSGGGVTVAAVDGDGTVLEPVEGLRSNATYDLTFTNLTLGNSSTGWHVRNPDGTQVGNARDVYVDSAHAGRYNVTFPSITLAGEGEWTLRDGDQVTRVVFTVQGPYELNVTLSPNRMTHQEGNVSFTVNVSPLASGETATLSGPGIPAGTLVTGPYGQYVYFGPSPGVGTHAYVAARDADGDGTDDTYGRGTLTVVAPPGSVTVSPSSVYEDETSMLTIRTWTGSGAVDPWRSVRLCGAPLYGSDVCGGSAMTDANGTAVVSVSPTQTGVIRVERTDAPANATVDVVTRAAPTLRIGNVSGSVLRPVTAPIHLDNVTDFGAVTMTLRYDASVVEVSNVTPGTIPGSAVAWNAENGTLTVLLTTDQAPGPTGSFVFANVTFRATGSAGAASVLDLEVVEAVHADGSAFAVSTADGRFRAGLLGDVNGDDLVDALDYAALSDHVVGKPPAGPVVLGNADLNRDGRVTGADALFLRQHLAGRRPVL